MSVGNNGFVQRLPFIKTASNLASGIANFEIFKRGVALPGSVLAVNPQDANTTVTNANAIVRIHFDDSLNLNLPDVVMPVFGPQYLRYPIQVGDTGVAFPVSVPTNGTTQMWDKTNNPNSAIPSTPNMPGNLAALVWFPCGAANWTPVWKDGGGAPAVADLNRVNLSGPQGVVISDNNGGTVTYYVEVDKTIGIVISNNADSNQITLNATQIELKIGSTTLIASSTGVAINGNVTVTGTIVATGNITAGSIDLETHVHPDPQGGNTGAPTG